jgi:phosphoglycerate kinase
MLAIIGGAKVSTKLKLLGNLISNVEMLAIGGAMANTFRLAQGISVGTSRVEEDMLDSALAVLGKASEQGCKIILPIDAVVASELAKSVETEVVNMDDMPEDKMILDIGPASADAIANAMAHCRTVLWNGPLGAFETPPFDTATVLLGGTTAALTEARKLVSVAGGGDTVAALSHAQVGDKLTYVSTAGGAFLEWVEGKTLPGLAIMYKE